MELYIVRHGETVWNAAGKLQGNADISLNENGIAAAERLGREVCDIHFDAIYSSPLVRAYKTALLIRGERDIPIITDERLREISFGDEEGSSYKKWLCETSPYRFFFTEPAKYVPPRNGESFLSVIERTADFLRGVIEPLAKSADRLMIVAHGALNKGLMCRIEGNSVENYWGDGLQKNCEASVFSFDGNAWSKIR